MKCLSVIITCCIILIVILIVFNRFISEGYGNDMGGRSFFGFGRGGDYGYSVFDVDFSSQQCYQITPLEACRQGYYRTTNYNTRADECCVNPTNYGYYYPASYIEYM